VSLRDLFGTIESHATSAEVNVASDLRTALKIAQSLPSVGTLERLLARSDVAESVLQRVLDVTDLSPDIRYEHPLDAALMIYSWLLRNRAPDLALVATSALSRVPNLWWTGQIAAAIANPALADQANAAGSSQGLDLANQGAGDRLVLTYLSFPRQVLHGSTNRVTDAGSQQSAAGTSFDGRAVSSDRTNRHAGEKRFRPVAA